MGGYVVRYVGKGADMRVLFAVRVEGWAWSLRLESCVQRVAGICSLEFTSSRGERGELSTFCRR